MKLRPVLLFLCSLLTASAAEPAVPLFSLFAPSASLPVDAPWQVDLVAFNPENTTVYYQPPGRLTARVNVNGRLQAVEFSTTESARLVLPPGGFGARHYFADRPPAGTGLIALEFPTGLPVVLRTALAVDPAATTPAAASAQPPPALRHLLNLNTASSAIERTFAGRFGLHESIYFIYGPDAPAAKFQISFKYRLLRLDDGDDGSFTHSVQAGYTQRSLWDIDANSSPFYDTSYMPELMLESLAPMPAEGASGITLLGTQLAFKHESNGRDGSDSRSLNTVVLRGGLLLGQMDHWHLILVPEIFTYVSSLEDNRDLKDYRGYGRLRAVLDRNSRRPSLVYAIQAGKGFNHLTHQVDLTIPFRTRWLDIETALLIQYFNGYGESLLDYTQKSETVRAGLSLVR